MCSRGSSLEAFSTIQKSPKTTFARFLLVAFFEYAPFYCLWFLLFLIGLMVVGTNSGASSEIPLYINGRLSWDPRAIFNLHIPLWSFPVFLQNIAIKPTGGGVPIWMGVTWSLGVEVQFLSFSYTAHSEIERPKNRVDGRSFDLNRAYSPAVDLVVWRFLCEVPTIAALSSGCVWTRDSYRSSMPGKKAVWQRLSSHRWLLYGLLLIFGSGFETLYRYPGTHRRRRSDHD